MARIKRGALIASSLLLVTLILSACNQPYSQAPSVTNTPINPNSLFATPLGQPTNMNDVQNFATGTALAIQGGTSVAGVETATPMANTTPVEGGSPTITPTAMIAIPTDAVTTATATLAVASTNQAAATSGVVNTSVPVGSRPATYTLQPGEFVYCLARRFDVDPDQILTLNGLSDGTTIYPGTVLKIPQSGSFPGTRALRNHPTTYTASAGDTLYSVACEFGDVDPQSIATTNGLSLSTTLSSGQTISIP